MPIENHKTEYDPLHETSGKAGIEFSKIEAVYNDQAFTNDFNTYASSYYKTRNPDRTYLKDKEKYELIKSTNKFQDKIENIFVKKFSSKEMTLKIQFFGNLYKQLNPVKYNRSNFTQKHLGELIKSGNKSELDRRLEFLKRTYIELRNSGKTHESIT